ncbi:hypothetical protein CICLE_v10023099mg [Citrus x clementina]|uniref:Uncharacterized protein n=1 Tax=Citrus clementina TaxID=85681 RepID=V4TC43_CITCL|nr:hypothetical protein CICLE_v10023099mg [Citrus x clementina]
MYFSKPGTLKIRKKSFAHFKNMQENRASSQVFFRKTIRCNLRKILLSTIVRTNPKIKIKACLLHQLDKLQQIIISLQIILKPIKKK